MDSKQDEITEQLVLDVESTMRHVPARRIIWEIYKTCGVYRANGGSGSPDLYSIGIHEGQRRIGLFIENLLSVMPTESLAKWKDEMGKKDALNARALEKEAQEYEHLTIKERE